MFAVFETGGKQYKVAENDVIKVEKLEGEVGNTIKFERVLSLGDDKAVKIGTPQVEGAVVSAEVLEQKKDKKVLIFKKKRRQNYRRTKGHRQEITVVRIMDVSGKGEVKKAPAKKAPAPKVEEAKAETPKKAEGDKAAPKKEAAKKAPAKKEAKPAAKKTASKDTKK